MLGWVLLGALVLLVVFVAAARVRSNVAPRPFPPWMTPILETPLRRLMRGAEKALDGTGLAAGQRALEVGPGAGYVSELALRRLGPAGRLVCVDIQSEMLRKVRRRLGHLGARAPALVRASGSELPFRDASFDVAYLITVLGEIPDGQGAMDEHARVLRRGGVLGVTEGLPDPDYVRPAVLVEMGRRAGFRVRERLGNWVSFTQRFER